MIRAHKIFSRSASDTRQILALATLAIIVITGSGCRLCCDRDDISYPAYGGIWERTNRDHGRVGSLFDPGGALVPDLDERGSLDSEIRRQFTPRQELPDQDPGEENQDRQTPPEKSESETDEEFQEKLRKFKEERMLNAAVIPGDPMPPEFR